MVDDDAREDTLRSLEALQDRLQHVYWLGGGSGAGKSTIARRIAAEHGMSVYSTDEVMSDHARRITDEDAPYLARFKSMSMDERWVHRHPEVMLETFHWFRGEGFKLIIEDLLEIPPDSGVIAEGFRLLPSLVQPMLADHDRALWLLPTPDFRVSAFESRGTTWDIANKTSDPVRALHNLLQRERMFTDLLREETRRLGLPTMEVDASMNKEELSKLVTCAFGIRRGMPGHAR